MTKKKSNSISPKLYQQFAYAFDHLTDSRSKQGTNIHLTGIIASHFSVSLPENLLHRLVRN